MELKGKDDYKIELSEPLSSAQLQSLMVCYQALIGPTAAALYLTLAQEAHAQHGFESHQRLCALMGIDIVAFELARGKCEEVGLITTWRQKTESRDHYLYCLAAPLKTEQFLAHDVLGRRYMQLVGVRTAEVTRAKATGSPLEKAGYANVSKRFSADALESWGQDDEMKFAKVKPAYSINRTIEKHIAFDYDTFLAESTNLSFPIEARTREALEVIGQLATVYGISADRMRVLVGHSVNNSTNVLDIQKLKNLASYEKPKEKKSKNPYDVSPVQFLSEKQAGIPVTPADGRLLEYLVGEMKLPQEVVNVLIETVLNQNGNRLSRSYVEKIAGTWVRNKVDTLDKALAAAKESARTEKTPIRSGSVRKAVLPKNFEENKRADNAEPNQTKPMSEEELQALKERLKRLEG